MSGKAPYFPNNWKKFKDAPPEMFTPHMFIEVMDWKVAGWELPSDVCCIIRATHLKTSKVKNTCIAGNTLLKTRSLIT